ncbi:aspartyl-phosphate phosphatase Spo0E family protein [Desulfosporosinus sp. PR]|uniref:aspartyl-phosphate phosphatase Spo0E family protein n=1 Tax=Candidatus Desulfosporosinus nitrosoreducens TaxID=3401928 RepID=UPI0027FF42FA|nr:aspartyl-phosphate phosphatase Spo0E family protein [Desulfosporosinus sp. PR]MDQ7097141.1 aspartyl-phosphate phosphatase Spo0E family protein [Desulfosporosinus sp. PR]
MKPGTLELLEKLRSQMHLTAADKDLTDPMVLRVSEELDTMIIDFYLGQKRKTKDIALDNLSKVKLWGLNNEG